MNSFGDLLACFFFVKNSLGLLCLSAMAKDDTRRDSCVPACQEEIREEQERERSVSGGLGRS